MSEDESDSNYQWMERNHINLAKAYLGYKGGYTLEQLKRIFAADKKDRER
jgi:hypothetical protein